MPQPAISRPRVFMLEDDETLVTLVGAAVAANQWEFRACGLVSDVMDIVRAFQPDIALLDVKLPDGEGFEVCRQIRADPVWAKIPVIFLTSKGEVASRLKGFSSGAQDYVLKPFVMEELLARVRAHLAIKAKSEELELELVQNRLRERVRQDVVDMVVHDLRSPLSTAKSTVDLVRQSGLIKNERYARYLDYANDSLDFALFMVNDLLDLSAGRIPVESRPVDWASLRGRLEVMLSIQYGAKKVALELDFPESFPLSSDPSLLFRILLNLLGNALKVSKPGFKVVVRASPAPQGARFEVIDRGPGIADAEKTAVFLKYFRSTNEKTSAVAGAGIGLAFCKLAAETLRGRIWVEDAEGGGCRFIVELPSLPAAA